MNEFFSTIKEKGSVEMVELLIKNGAEVRLSDDERVPILVRAVQQGLNNMKFEIEKSVQLKN